MRGGWVAAVIAISACLEPGSAHAQAKGDVARADALFQAAKALLDSGQYVDACAKFAESKRLAPGLGVTLYLADCYEHIGRTASAWSEFLSAEGLARERNDRRAEVARGRAQALEPKLDRITITVAPTIPQTGLQVLRDGAVVPPEEWGLAVPIDPGDHVVLVSSPGHSQRTFNVRLGTESHAGTVRIDSLDEPSPLGLDTPAAATASTPPTTSASAASPAELPPSSDGGSAPRTGATRRWIGLGIGGAGVIGLGLGSAFGLMAKSKLNQSNDGPCNAATNKCTQAGLSLRQDAGNAATASTIAFVAGGVALAAGIVLYVTAPRAAPISALVVAPAPLAGGGGAIVQGRF
jgi:hypothetical protein